MTDRILEVTSVIILFIVGAGLVLVGLFSPRARHSLEVKVAAFDRAFLDGQS